MREIRFRGRCVKTGKWLYGDLISHPNGGLAIGDYNARPMVQSVDPATGGQYTGLVDKSGKEIYEGDIVCAYNGKYIGEVFYQAPEFAIQNFKELRLNFFEYMPNGELNFGVIGNKWDNPDLLGGEHHV